MSDRKVCFRIRGQYKGHGGFPDRQSHIDFVEDTRQLFQDAGWTLHAKELNRGICDTVTKGQQDLYLHPMSFSGVVLEDEIPQLEAMLAQAKTFHCYAVDRYEEYVDLSDEAYWALLESKREEVVAAILERYRSKRRNIFFTSATGAGIASKFSVNRLCDKQGRQNKANLFVSNLMEQLIAEGRLVTANTKRGQGIRTATKEELQHLAG